MVVASLQLNTASGATEQNMAILSLRARGMSRSARHSSTSGWMPRARSSLTLCWVGLDFSSPAALM